MKMQEAMYIINNEPNGFMVSFEWCGDGFLRGDHFPDMRAGEPLIKTEEEAWNFAAKFAKAKKGEVCNIYVIDHKFRPVDNYREKKIANRESKKLVKPVRHKNWAW